MFTLSQMLPTLVNANFKALCVKVHLPYYFMVEKFATSFHVEDLLYGLSVQYNIILQYHALEHHTILLLKNLQYHSTWKINCRVPTYCTYNTICGWYEALRSFANQCDQ